MLEMA